MAGRFSYSRGAGLQDPWFRIGNIDIGSAALLSLACAVMMVVGAFVTQLSSVFGPLGLVASDVRAGQVWRLVTWPLASPVDLWPALSIVILWWVGTRLEVQTGRTRMAFLLGLLIVVIGVFAAAIGANIAGAEHIEFVILLLFIAEYPKAPFFFGIPAWILGAFFVALRILSLVANRQEIALLVFLFSMILGAIGARSIGLLAQYDFIPRIPLPASLAGSARRATRKAGNAPRRNHRGRVVDGPWAQSPPADDTAAAQAELDLLLDKISASGLESLSKQERQRLNELSKKLR